MSIIELLLNLNQNAYLKIIMVKSFYSLLGKKSQAIALFLVLKKVFMF